MEQVPGLGDPDLEAREIEEGKVTPAAEVFRRLREKRLRR